MNGQKTVFLDRDGTIAHDAQYCSRPEDFQLLEGAAEAISLLKHHGFLVIIITNQSGLARGYFNEEALDNIHRKMRDELARGGTAIDGLYYCPHHPDDGCNCRKPQPGLVRQALAEHDIDLTLSYFVGDLPIDIELGKAIGCRTVLVTQDRRDIDAQAVGADYVAPTILDAARYIVDKDAERASA